MAEKINFQPITFTPEPASTKIDFKPVDFVPERPQEDRGLLSKGFDYGMRALDYPGGLVRTGIAEAADVFAPGNKVTGEDWGKAIRGQAPSSAQYMEKFGVPEMGSVSTPLGDISTRDVGGFALDVATDPLGGLIKAAKPVARGLKGAGEKLYASGLKKVDERLLEKGSEPLSGLLLREGAPTGTTKKLAGEADKIKQAKLAERTQLFDQATQAGAKVDMTSATAEAEKLVARMRRDPGLKDMADKVEELINRYKSEGFVDMPTASEWKTNLYNALPESAYDSFGKVKGPAKEIQKALARGFKNSIELAGDSVQPGLGKKIASINEDIGTVIGSQKPMAMQIRRAKTPMHPSQIDAMLGGYGVLGDPVVGGGVLAAKKAAQLANTTYGRTKMGKGLLNVSKTPYLDPAIERYFINQNREE